MERQWSNTNKPRTFFKDLRSKYQQGGVIRTSLLVNLLILKWKIWWRLRSCQNQRHLSLKKQVLQASLDPRNNTPSRMNTSPPFLICLISITCWSCPRVKRLEDARKTNNSIYSLYHRIINHLTKNCYIIKDKILVLMDANILKLHSKQKKVLANIVTIKVGTWNIIAVSGIVPILKGEIKVAHYDPHN